MNTKFIKIAIYLVCFCVSGFVVNADDGGSVGIQLDQVTTLSGSVYRNVEVVSADGDGLLFRHANGAAKVEFSDLSANLREMFMPVLIEEDGKGADPIDDDDGKGADPVAANDADDGSYEELFIETRSRIVINLPNCHANCGCRGCNPFDPRNVIWRSHWGRYHYGHSYANFYCRQAAERDLLIRSGFLR